MAKQVQKQTKPLVTEDMTIGDVVSKYPAAAEVMMRHGLHCVGCGAAYMETIKEGTMGHGWSSDQLNKMMTELNEVLTHEDSGEVVTLTAKAADKVKDLLSKDNKEKTHVLRVGVKNGGCSGMMYDLSFVESSTKESGDTELEQHGVKILLNNESKALIKGAKIDFVDSLQGSGFKITNPNAQSTCGCGESFS